MRIQEVHGVLLTTQAPKINSMCGNLVTGCINKTTFLVTTMSFLVFIMRTLSESHYMSTIYQRACLTSFKKAILEFEELLDADVNEEGHDTS